MSFPKQELSSLHDDEEINPLAKQSSQTQASITKRPASPSERDIDHRESITSRKRSRKNNVRTTMHQNGSDGKPLTLIVGTLKENPAIDVFTKKKNLSSLANSSAIPALHFFVDADDFKQVHKMINTIAPNEIVFLPQYELGNAEKTRSHLVSLLSVDFMPRKDGGIGGRKETIEPIEDDVSEKEELDEHKSTSSKRQIIRRSFSMFPAKSPPSHRSATSQMPTHRSPSSLHRKASSAMPKYHTPHHHRQAAMKLFDQSMDIIEKPLKQQIHDQEKQLKEVLVEGTTNKNENLQLRARVSDLEAEVARLKDKLNGNMIATPTQLINSHQPQMRTQVHDSPANKKYSTISGREYEILDGLNARFLKGADGPLYIHGDAACRDFSLLREEKSYHFSGSEKEDLVLKKETVGIKDGGKEYVSFSCTRSIYL